MHYLQKNVFVFALLPGRLANSNENYRPNNFQVFANISGKFTTLNTSKLTRSHARINRIMQSENSTTKTKYLQHAAIVVL